MNISYLFSLCFCAILLSFSIFLSILPLDFLSHIVPKCTGKLFLLVFPHSQTLPRASHTPRSDSFFVNNAQKSTLFFLHIKIMNILLIFSPRSNIFTFPFLFGQKINLATPLFAVATQLLAFIGVFHKFCSRCANHRTPPSQFAQLPFSKPFQTYILPPLKQGLSSSSQLIKS